ncbi:DNA primase [Paraburkholderia sp. BR13439]|uniref:DNA primase n=1 Tax=Paraburkholderia sp. BR13439 TaxID=3236996 RepID=UPI0034CF5AB7
MTATVLLDRLDGVRSCGPGRWRARCPACDSHKPVLAITETADGVVLLHCFRNECAAPDIVSAVGQDIADLFPPRVEGVHAAVPAKRRFSARQVLGAVNLELLEVLVIVGAIRLRGSVMPAEYERLKLAVARVSVAEGATHD